MEEELLPKKEDRIICLKVGKILRDNLYEMTCKYWKLDINRARKSTHVLSVVNGIVKEVYIPTEWKLTDNPQYAGRYEFTGIEDDNSTYIGKSVKSIYGRGSNPVKYINL